MSDITGRSLPFKMKMHLRQALLPRFAALNRRRKRNSHFIQLQIKNRMLNRLELRLKAMKYDHEAQITGLLHSLKRREELDAGSVWYWQEEGDNAVETLACQVVMEAGVVRKFVKAVDELAAERERADRAERDALECGHPASLMLHSAETGEPLYCELCDIRSQRNDAVRMEEHYKARAEKAEAERDALRERVARLNKEAGDLRARVDTARCAIEMALEYKLPKRAAETLRMALEGK